ncbi:MAG: holo-ACP synthase [Pseudomonadota bacterium]|jgi:holo-[acyl-carrier protein] synthase
MILGIGIDRCTIARMEAVHGTFGPRLLSRLLTSTEQAQKEWTAAALARRWACKEAVAKALGTGIGEAFGFQDIEITYSAKGAPQCHVASAEGTMHISVSDDDGVAIAYAVWER